MYRLILTMKMFFNKLLSMAIRILLLLPLNIYSNVVIERFSLVEVVYEFFRTTAIVKKSVGKKTKNGSQLMCNIAMRILQAIF